MTERVFMVDANLAACMAVVMAAGTEGIVLDRTVFYARSGGQAGDIGSLVWDGGETAIADTIKGDGETILHLPAPGAALPPVSDRRSQPDSFLHRNCKCRDALREICARVFPAGT